MKKIFSVSIITAALFFLNSCDKKDEVSSPGVTATGEWIGKRGPTTTSMVDDWKFVITSNGGITVSNFSPSGAAFEWGKGTWTLTGNDSIKATIDAVGQTHIISAGISKDNKQLNGFYSTGGQLEGYFQLNKQ